MNRDRVPLHFDQPIAALKELAALKLLTEKQHARNRNNVPASAGGRRRVVHGKTNVVPSGDAAAPKDDARTPRAAKPHSIKQDDEAPSAQRPAHAPDTSGRAQQGRADPEAQSLGSRGNISRTARDGDRGLAQVEPKGGQGGRNGKAERVGEERVWKVYKSLVCKSFQRKLQPADVQTALGKVGLTCSDEMGTQTLYGLLSLAPASVRDSQCSELSRQSGDRDAGEFSHSVLQNLRDDPSFHLFRDASMSIVRTKESDPVPDGAETTHPRDNHRDQLRKEAIFKAQRFVPPRLGAIAESQPLHLADVPGYTPGGGPSGAMSDNYRYFKRSISRESTGSVTSRCSTSSSVFSIATQGPVRVPWRGLSLMHKESAECKEALNLAPEDGWFADDKERHVSSNIMGSKDPLSPTHVGDPPEMELQRRERNNIRYAHKLLKIQLNAENLAMKEVINNHKADRKKALKKQRMIARERERKRQDRELEGKESHVKRVGLPARVLQEEEKPVIEKTHFVDVYDHRIVNGQVIDKLEKADLSQERRHFPRDCKEPELFHLAKRRHFQSLSNKVLDHKSMSTSEQVQVSGPRISPEREVRNRRLSVGLPGDDPALLVSLSGPHSLGRLHTDIHPKKDLNAKSAVPIAEVKQETAKRNFS